MITIFSQIGIDADQLGDAVAHAGGRQIDHAGVEAVTVIDAFAHVVVDWDVAERRGQHLAAAAGRRAEHDVAAGEGVADRRDLARFAAQDVEDADAVLARGEIGERGDAKIVGEALDTLLEHRDAPGSAVAGSLCYAPLASMPSFAAMAARPPARIQVVHVLGVVDDLGDRAVEAEEAVGQAELVAGFGERAHAAHEVRPAAADHDDTAAWGRGG